MYDEMQIGETREVNGMRVHLYDGSLHVTDIRNAGRRGKACGCVVASDWPRSAALSDLADEVLASPNFDAARAVVLGSRFNPYERTFRAIDVEPAADAALSVVFVWNGIRVGGKVVSGHWSHSDAWTDYAGTVHAEHITFYARDLSHATELLRRTGLAVENSSDSMTDYFESDQIRFGLEHPRYAEAAAALAAKKGHDERRRAARAAR